MERLGPSDYEAVLSFLRSLYAVERLEEFPRRAMAGLGRLIESDLLTYREIYPRRTRAEFLTLGQFQNLALHSAFFRTLGLHYQIAVTIPSTQELVIRIALSRSRADFSERDRTVLAAIRPHLAQAYRNAADRTALEERTQATERALRSSTEGDLDSLTRREHEVLVHVANGKTNPQIADCLSLSPRTVQKHLEHIYEKVGVRTRTAAAMKLASSGR